jgi:hypothetical protein
LQNGQSVTVVLALKHEKESGDITSRETDDLEALSGLTPYTPRFVELMNHQGIVYYIEEFIEGQTLREMQVGREGPPPLPVRKEIINALLSIASWLDDANMPKDMHFDNIIVKPSKPDAPQVVVVDLGQRRIQADRALARLVAFYGERADRRASLNNEFIFNAFLTHFGKVQGLRLLDANYSHLSRARAQERRGRKMEGVSSPKKQVIREDRQEPQFSGKDTDLLLSELEDFLLQHEGLERDEPATHRPLFDLLKLLLVSGTVYFLGPATLVFAILPAWKAVVGYRVNRKRGLGALDSLVKPTFTDRNYLIDAHSIPAVLRFEEGFHHQMHRWGWRLQYAGYRGLAQAAYFIGTSWFSEVLIRTVEEPIVIAAAIYSVGKTLFAGRILNFNSSLSRSSLSHPLFRAA